MALTKNTPAATDDKAPNAATKAAATKAAKKAAAPVDATPPTAPVKETKPKASKPKAEPAPAAEVETEVEPKAVLGKKQIAEGLREYVRAQGMGLPQKLAELIVDGFDSVVVNALANGQEVRTQLGRFFATEVASRKGRNPSTGAEIEMPAHTQPKFKPSPTFKKLLNGGVEEQVEGVEGDAEAATE